MPKAMWSGQLLANATDDQVQVVEGNVYFPMEAVDQNYLQPTSKTTTCPWKGLANYYDVIVEGKVNGDAAWTYRTPSDAAKQIAGHVAFWKGVEVIK
jgi:uncharacterized protein (DUF427 family)